MPRGGNGQANVAAAERREHAVVERGAEADFYIAATVPPSRARFVLKHDDTFVMIDSHGDIGADPGGPDGVFDADTRCLSRLVLAVEGGQPLLLGSDVRDDNLNLSVDLTNPDIVRGGRIVLAKDTVHISRTCFVRDGALRQRIAIVNHGLDALSLTVSLELDSDFADVFEVRGVKRARRGRLQRIVTTNGVDLVYTGTDGAGRQTSISFSPPPGATDDRMATFDVALEPGGVRIIFVEVACRGPQPRFSFTGELAGARREHKAATQHIARVSTANSIVDETLHRSLCDLYMLTSATPQGPYPYAGIPWYSTTFGRDGLITALQMLWFDPRIARGVLTRLARHQATALDAAADAEPGKILHEMRAGEMARVGEVPFGLYYGSVDSTPLFVILAGRYAQRTGDYALVRRLWPAIEGALGWLDLWGDRDGDGLIEYGASGGEGGLANQGWKDSSDSVFHADGRLAKGPIALVEVQGYAYLARRLAAQCARRLGLTARAGELEIQCRHQRDLFETAFWCEDIQTYALALDGEKRACRVRSSNPAHALFTGIMRAERARLVAADIMRPHFLTGWGVRTIAQDEARYNPMSYHNGSVWPHDNAMIAMGLEHYGLKAAAEPIFRGIMDAARYMQLRRLPELFCGFRRRPGRGPTLYPVACSPQAWAAGAPFQFVQTMLGLEFDYDRRLIVLKDPLVPEFLGHLTVRNLRLGQARADFRLERQTDGRVALQLLAVEGDVEISLAFPGRPPA